MKYRVLLERNAERDLNNLQPSIRQDIIRKVLHLQDNPRPQGCKKLEGSAHNWRLRHGAYRILYAIDDSSKTVYVYRIKHRKEAYR
ncbi:MAG: type II toxin-antitoxin system RelE/ParE family toxin [Elusimicrobia bacterium]|nr:type II toxin-antitoxin system RelE/ParE family toxin [Elusimicrobiota bacterium]